MEEDSKSSNSSIIGQSNKLKNSWNNSYSTKASSCSWTELQTNNSAEDQLSVWRTKDSLNEFSQKIIIQAPCIKITWTPIYPLHILHLMDGIIILGYKNHSNQQIPNYPRYNNLFNEFTNN